MTSVRDTITRDFAWEETIMKRIKETRLNRGLSVAQLAKRLGVTERLILKWEKDGSTIGRLILPLSAIARALEVPAAFLLTGNETAPPPDDTDRYVYLILHAPNVFR